MKIINLGSGSKGNATLIKINSGYILIDCGLRKFEEQLKNVGILFEEIKYVFITHNHGDHILNILKFDPSIIYTGEYTIDCAHNIIAYLPDYSGAGFVEKVSSNYVRIAYEKLSGNVISNVVTRIEDNV